MTQQITIDFLIIESKVFLSFLATPIFLPLFTDTKEMLGFAERDSFKEHMARRHRNPIELLSFVITVCYGRATESGEGELIHVLLNHMKKRKGSP